MGSFGSSSSGRSYIIYIYYKLKCVVAARAPPRVIICICMSRNARNAGGCDGNVDVKPTYDINEIILLLLLYCATSQLSYYSRMRCSRR